MSAENVGGLRVREAEEADVSALCGLKAGAALHRDRLRDADSPDFRYLVLTQGETVIGFACLVFVRPASWSDAADLSCLPQIVDLQVSEPLRGRGHGSFFIRELEQIAVNRGCHSLYLAVDFPANTRAHALYQRLGYRQLQPEPYGIHWEITDSEGHLHQGDGQRVDMSKSLTSRPDHAE